MALINFNAANVETQSNFDPIPNGWYNTMITESEMKPTQAGTGHYLQCQLKVIDGDFANRVLFLRLNLDNPNKTAVEIAYSQLATICKAVGLVQVNDSSELHNKPFQAKVVIRPPKDQYEASNDIKGFKEVSGGGAGSSGGSVGGGDKPSWAAKKEPVQKEEPPVVEHTAVADTTIEPEANGGGEASAEGKPPWMK
jgi:hypothetical protein